MNHACIKHVLRIITSHLSAQARVVLELKIIGGWHFMNHACSVKHVLRIITSQLSSQVCVVPKLKIICSHVSSQIYIGIHATGCFKLESTSSVKLESSSSINLAGFHEHGIFYCRKVHKNEELIEIFA
ncbi:hypothetical protein AMTRI_Chr13g89390 [Amborella trichopoda]